MHSIVKSVLKYTSIFIIAIIIFVVLLIISSLFPREWLERNVYESSKTLLIEKNPNFVLDMRLDNYTDALMINTAISIDPKHPFESAMLARKNYLPEKEQVIHQDQKRRISLY